MGNNQTPTGWVSIGSPELSSTSDNYYTAGSGWLNAPLPNSPVNGFSVFPVTREGSPLEGCQTTITGLIAGSSYNILYEYMWPKGFGLYASRFDIGLANQGYIEIDGVKTYVSIHSGNGGLVNTWYCGIKTFTANGPTATLKLGIDVSGSIDNSAIAWAIFGNTSSTINLGNDTTLCQGGTLALDATTLNATYLWQDNSTNPTFNVNQQGTYWVQVTVNNCNSSDTISINLKDCHCSLYIPNSFTPNSDNKNDHFSPIFDCDITEYNFTIFNRWGELLFETTNPTNSWNGTFKGKICQTGIFIYLLKYKDNKNTHQKKYGHVNLLK